MVFNSWGKIGVTKTSNRTHLFSLAKSQNVVYPVRIRLTSNGLLVLLANPYTMLSGSWRHK